VHQVGDQPGFLVIVENKYPDIEISLLPFETHCSVSFVCLNYEQNVTFSLYYPPISLSSTPSKHNCLKMTGNIITVSGRFSNFWGFCCAAGTEHLRVFSAWNNFFFMSVGDITPRKNVHGDVWRYISHFFLHRTVMSVIRVRVCKLRLERGESIFSFNSSRPEFSLTKAQNLYNFWFFLYTYYSSELCILLEGQAFDTGGLPPLTCWECGF
jgi:hypothetical protein